MFTDQVLLLTSRWFSTNLPPLSNLLARYQMLMNNTCQMISHRLSWKKKSKQNCCVLMFKNWSTYSQTVTMIERTHDGNRSEFRRLSNHLFLYCSYIRLVSNEIRSFGIVFYIRCVSHILGISRFWHCLKVTEYGDS